MTQNKADRVPGPSQNRGAPVDPLEVRSNPRVGTDLPVEIYTSDFGGALVGRSRDLSIGGACIATPSPFSFKSLQRITLGLPTRNLTLDAVGCWQREDPHERIVLTGIAFDDPHPEQLEAVWDQVLDSGKKLARFLYEQTALHELGLEEAMGLAQVTRYRNLQPGDMIYRQGTQGSGNDSIFLITEGSVTLQLRIRDAIEQPLAQLTVGDLFGGLPLLADIPHAESAVANTAVRLLEVDRASFRHLRSMKPWLGHRLGVALLRVHAQRMAETLGLASQSL
ncbi:MAG TPA: cyclic nucleotide-binding domain-containing protein [Deltaproteobacteria bacterium]|nr:cyclic nucleotide-binding domain-containing protein [Deltaproteobacteria bacterium]